MALRDNMLGYWDLGEVSGNRADATGNGETLTDANTVASASDGGITVADFESANTEYLYRTDTLGAYNNTFTYSFWIKHESLPSAGNLFNYISHQIENGSLDMLNQIDISNTAGVYSLRAFNNYQSTSYTWTGVSTGTWYHIVVVIAYNTSSTGIKIYLNGTNVANASSDVGRSQGTTASDFSIGRYWDLGGNSLSRYVDGLMKFVGLWNRGLSADEITSLYNSGSGLNYAGTSSATNVTVTPNALVLTSSLPTPAVSAVRNVSVSAGVLSLTTSLPTPSVLISAQVSPNTLTLTTSLQTPAISAGGNVIVTPATLTLTSSVPEPTVSVEVSVTVTPAVLAITTSTPEPSVSLGTGVSVAVLPFSLSASLPTPTVLAEKDVTVTVSPLTLSISLQEPSKIGATWQRIGRYGSSDDWSRVARTDVA